MPCNDCSRTETCPPCPEEDPEYEAHDFIEEGHCAACAKDFEDQVKGIRMIPRPEPTKSDFLRCRCDHFQMNHRPVTKGGCRNCSCDGFKLKTEEPERLSLTAACACSHVNNWHVRADHSDTHCAATGCPCGAFRASSEDEEEPRCLCGKSRSACDEHDTCDETPEEPPLTPEEEEAITAKFEAADAEHLPPPEEPCQDCLRGAHGPNAHREEPPPQPERRPPYAVAYSVQGHLYEVALSGDATVRAVDGALVIQHHLGPVAGLVSVMPVINKEG